MIPSLACPATAGVAVAHVAGPDYVSEIRAVTPPVPGLEVRVLGSDSRLEISNPGHHRVVVLGCRGEPYARLQPDGSSQVNERSPATYLNRDRFGTAAPPAEADPRAAPVWRPYATTGPLDWHDHRSHWMGSGRPPQVKNVSLRTRVFDYRIPIVVDGRRTSIEGTLYWAGRPGAPPVIAALAIMFIPIVLGGSFVLWRTRGVSPASEPRSDPADTDAPRRSRWLREIPSHAQGRRLRPPTSRIRVVPAGRAGSALDLLVRTQAII